MAKKEQFIINVRPRDSVASGRPRVIVGLIVLLATLIVAPAAVAVDVPLPVVPVSGVPLPGVPETVGAGAPPETVANATPVGGRVLGVRELRIGSTGADVRELQTILRRRGFRVTVDGAFGIKTRNAVKALQRRLKVRRSGVVTPALLKRLGIKIRDVRSGTPTAPATPVDPSTSPLAGPNAAKAVYLKAFPVAGKHTYSNDWGAPRSQGSHQGTDVMAARGVPVRAVADGTIKRLTRAETGLGGIWIWLKDARGNEYYYAHLNTITDGVEVGTAVTAGQVVGTVGNTGDARYGATHLHFEIHPGGGGAVNPHPDLTAVDPAPPTR